MPARVSQPIPSHSNAVIALPASAFAQLEAVLKDPFLKVLFRGAINPGTLDYRVSPLDVTTQVVDGDTTFCLRESIAQTLWLTVVKLAQIIQCAGNDYNPYEANEHPLPLSIPDASFRAIGFDPLILPLVLFPATVNPLLRQFPSISAIEEEVFRVVQIVQVHIQWLAVAISRSLDQGVRSPWRWGAYFAVPWGDFMERVAGREGVYRVTDREEAYDLTAIHENVAVILHPEHSSVAKEYRARLERAKSVFEGNIPVDTTIDRDAYISNLFTEAVRSMSNNDEA